MKGWKIFILAIILYGVSVFGGFVQDDTKVILGDSDMGKVISLVSAFVRPYYFMDGGNAGVYRPLTSFSFYLNALITGKGPWGFHLVNIVMYGGLCWIVFEILRKICSEKIAFWGTVIFTVLPIHTEVVNNIVGRAEIFSLGFVLLAILMQDKKKWEISAGMFLLALLSKETAIVGLPILVYLMTIGKEKKDIKIGVSIFYVLVVICYLVLRMMVLGAGGMENNATMVENPLKFVTAGERVINAIALIPLGIGKTLFPLNLSYDYSFNQLKLVTNLFDWRVLLGGAIILLSLGSMFTKLRKNKGWILGQILFWGPLTITGNILFPIGTIFGERLWFWSSLGVILLIASCFSLRPHSLLATDNLSLPASDNYLDTRREILNRSSKPSISRLRNVAQRKMDSKKNIIQQILFLKYFGFVLIIVFASRTLVRNVDWLSQERLFVHDAMYVKNSVMAQSNAAAMFLMNKDFVKAKEYLERAEKIFPKYPELMNNWGMYYLWSGDLSEAKSRFEKCLSEKPNYYLCKSNLNLIK